MAREAPLLQINPDNIRPNPENPRFVFHEDEMNRLLQSIREVGIKVPLTLYEEKGKFTLLDGERRWRCAKRLNLTSIPALIQPKPTELENLLMMFNIHNVSVAWDLMPMAAKLAKIRDLLSKEGRSIKPRDLAAITGVSLTTVKRALTLLDLPKKYQSMLMKEALKPRPQQRLKPDLFFEAYKSLHTVELYMPEVFKSVTKTDYVDSMVNKYAAGVINDVVQFRDLSKIARAERAGVDKKDALPVVIKLVKVKNYSIDEAYEDTVQAAYEQRDLRTRLHKITDSLAGYKTPKRLSDDVRAALEQLKSEIDRLLGK